MTIFSQMSDPDSQDLRDVLQIYIDSFPPNERHPADVIQERLSHGLYRLIVGRVRQEIVFMALLWPLRGTEFVLLEYMATKSDHRGRGIGSEFLKRIPKSAELAGKYLIMEVENPEFGDNRQERADRVGFYRRHGAKELKGVRYVMPGLSGGAPTEMILMILPQYDAGKIDGATVRAIIIEIYEGLYNRGIGDDLLKSFVHKIIGPIDLI